MRKILTGFLLVVWALFFQRNALAAETLTTHGKCSPIVAHVEVKSININIKCNGEEIKIPILNIDLPRNSEVQDIDASGRIRSDGSTRWAIGVILSALKFMQKNVDELIYLRLVTQVGVGFGLRDLESNRLPRAGVVFDLDDYLDGFAGQRENYEYGYHIETCQTCDRMTILFPKKGTSTFDVRYGGYMLMEGFARLSVSGFQGSEWLEIIPMEASGVYLKAYQQAKREINR